MFVYPQRTSVLAVEKRAEPPCTERHFIAQHAIKQVPMGNPSLLTLIGDTRALPSRFIGYVQWKDI